MEATLKGTVRYDGTRFAGWQRQSNGRTVQGEIETAMARIAGRHVAVQGAGRTDAGVHALGQVFSCRWPGDPPERLRHALSQMLSPEIRITRLVPVADDFNARFSAKSKRYCYAIDTGSEADPFSARYAWHVPYRLDLALMASLLPKLVGRHDFAGFQSTGSQMKTTVRTLYSATLEQGGLVEARDGERLWRFNFHGDGFLYHMVRNMVGTLVEIGRGRFDPAFLDQCVDAPGPFLGHCAPAHGLAMAEVFYDEVTEEPCATGSLPASARPRTTRRTKHEASGSSP